MSGLRRKWTRRTAQFAAVGMLAASGSMFFASTALAAGAVKPPAPGGGPGGNNGTVQINGGDIGDKGNEPHLSCPITISWSGFDVPVPPTPDNHYSVAFSGIQPTGGHIDIDTARSDLSSDDFNTANLHKVFYLSSSDAKTNHKGEIHVNITVTTTAAHATDTKSKTVWIQGCAVPPAANDVTVNGACDPVAHVFSWSVVSNPADPVDGTWTPHSGGTATPWSVASGGSFTTGLVNDIDLTAPGWTLHPSSHVTAAPDVNCAAVVPPPGGGKVTVTGQCNTTTQGYDWIVTASGNAAGVSGTWAAPTGGTGGNWTTGAGGTANFSSDVGQNIVNITVTTAKWTGSTTATATACAAAGQADPVVTEANHCASGMNLTLSNMNGTAPATFTVVDPDGTVQTVSVNAGQLKKLVFAVKEDTTGTISVTAQGGSKQQFAYKKNCASVLGVKHTRKPTTHKPVVEGEHQQLPFTGFDTKRALLDGSVVFFLGAVLCILGARRREEEPLYY